MIEFEIFTPQIDFDIGDNPSVEFDLGNIVVGGGVRYTGVCEATPSNAEQVFETDGKMMPSNFVVKPIPQNYGLITYNGSTITVS